MPAATPHVIETFLSEQTEARMERKDKERKGDTFVRLCAFEEAPQHLLQLRNPAAPANKDIPAGKHVKCEP